MSKRSATIQRETNETQIEISIDLDGTGQANFDLGVPFLEHMLDQVARHGMFDLTIKAKGDLEIDAHHTVEDVGITLGQAFVKALGDKKAYEDTVMPTCLWTRPCHVSFWIVLADPDWNILPNIPAPGWGISILIYFLNSFRALLIMAW